MAVVPYDAILLLSFGGPEGPDDVIPFLENVLRGRNVPRERMLEVAEHYYHFGGRSPINDHNRALLRVLDAELKVHGPSLQLYWGNRNWHPLIEDTVRQMTADGVRHALVFATSAFSSYSACRQYVEDLERARAAAGPDAPQLDKLRLFFNHPGFIEPMIERVDHALRQFSNDRRAAVRLVFSAHSVPLAMAERSHYLAQLAEASRLVGEGAGHPEWTLVYQSRSGPPSQPWLEPDILDHLRTLAAEGAKDVVLCPIGFVSDHMEVLYDLDYEAAHLAQDLGLHLVRTGTVGVHPRFVTMIRELIAERVSGADRLVVGAMAPPPDVCPADCCPPPMRRA
ncbi:MAG: ferrochelatase [Bryobacterales bacterium]|nr:ferrochelatase [Bryobacterales bacterium]